MSNMRRINYKITIMLFGKGESTGDLKELVADASFEIKGNDVRNHTGEERDDVFRRGGIDKKCKKISRKAA